MKLFSLTIVTILALSTPSIALAENYKTDKNKVVVEGLESQKEYEITTVNNKGKQGKRQKRSNSCGQLLIDNGTKYKSLTVAGTTVDPSTLIIKKHDRCQPNKKSKTTPNTPKNKTVKLKLPASTPSPNPNQ